MKSIGNNMFENPNGISINKHGSCEFSDVCKLGSCSVQGRSPAATVKRFGKDTVYISSRQLGENAIVFDTTIIPTARHSFLYDGKRITRIPVQEVFERAKGIYGWGVCGNFEDLPIANASDKAMKAFKQFVKAIRDGRIKLPKNCI